MSPHRGRPDDPDSLVRFGCLDGLDGSGPQRIEYACRAALTPPALVARQDLSKICYPETPCRATLIAMAIIGSRKRDVVEMKKGYVIWMNAVVVKLMVMKMTCLNDLTLE